MKKSEYHFTFEVYDSDAELSEQDAWLLQEARKISRFAYAPYSCFQVGAVAKLSNGKIVTGTNQENASYPAGVCAERVLLGTAGSMYPEVPIETIAISYLNGNGNSDYPVTPCGICRQSLQEFEGRVGQPIRLILAGKEGRIYIIPQSGMLLPLAFTNEDL